MTDQVSFAELQCSQGEFRVGVATLDNPQSLNALTLNMLVQLKAQLEKWQDDKQIVCVVLLGSGEKAFCAGGDVRTMHQVMCEEPKAIIEEFCTRYFSVEYQTDYLIHTYKKPVIAWGDGIVMGGGMGLFMASSHKVVTPKSRLAMPEISIGLYPDVGGTWFLNRLEPGIGLFLGLTGAVVNASDALDIHLADHFLLAEHKDPLLESLQNYVWQCGANQHAVVTDILESLSRQFIDNMPVSQLKPFREQIISASSASDLGIIQDNIMIIEGDSHWLAAAKKTFAEGSPITAHICHRQVTQCHSLSLPDCFRQELTLSVRSAVLGEFKEGVRARLIDKDGQPDWMYKSIDDVERSVIDTLFTSLWTPETHPLSQLGQNI